MSVQTFQNVLYSATNENMLLQIVYRSNTISHVEIHFNTFYPVITLKSQIKNSY